MPVFRVTDERGWSRELAAHSGDELRAGIRAAWDTWIGALSTSGDVTHPAFALAARLADIRSWLAPRMARTNATDEQRRSWEAQAAHWTYEATRDLGGATHLSPLRLHVQAEDATWCTLCRLVNERWQCDPIAPQVARVEPLERCADLFAGGVRMVEWARELGTFADHVGEVVREAQHPRPTLVRSDV
jgi:hypothetical protein